MPYKRTADRIGHAVQQVADFAGVRNPHIGKAGGRPRLKVARGKRKQGRRY